MTEPSLNNQIFVSANTGSARTHLGIVMPAYNEGSHIEENLLKTVNIVSGFISDFCIIAVNDGSSDNTKEAMEQASQKDNRIFYVSYEHNKGKGGAIATGTAYANCDYIAFLDSDLELSPAMLKDFLRELKDRNADIAIGSKLHRDSKLSYPLGRRIISFGYFVLLKLMFNLNLKDTQTGIKLFKAQVIKPICKNLSTKGFAFDIEILATASKMGYKIIEMPIELNYSRTGTEKSKVSLGTIKNVFKDTLYIKKKIKNL